MRLTDLYARNVIPLIEKVLILEFNHHKDGGQLNVELLLCSHNRQHISFSNSLGTNFLMEGTPPLTVCVLEQLPKTVIGQNKCSSPKLDFVIRQTDVVRNGRDF